MSDWPARFDRKTGWSKATDELKAWDLLKSRYTDQAWVTSYGAKGDGVTDDTSAILAAMAANWGKHIYFPSGTYLITQSLTITDDITIEGDYDTIIRAGASMSYVLGGSTAWKRLTLRSLQIDANDLATYGLDLYYTLLSSVIEQVHIYDAVSDGVRMRSCMAMEVRDSYSYSNGGHGWDMLGCSATTMISCRAGTNTGDGFYIATLTINATTYQAGMYLYGLSSETNSGHGIELVDIQNPFYLSGAWIEANTLDGIRADDSVGTVTGCRVSGLGTGTNYAIHLVGDTVQKSGVVVINNKMASIPPGGDENYHSAKDDTGTAWIANNWNGGAEWVNANVLVLTGDDAITINDGTVLLTKSTGTQAVTLADPITALNGRVLHILSTTARAHTVTIAGGLNGVGSGADVGTFGGAIGDGFSLVAYGGKWYNLPNANKNVTFG